MTVQPEQDPTPEVPEETVERPTWPEVRQTAGEIKNDVVEFIGEEVVELISAPVKDTTTEYLRRIKTGVRNFVIGVKTPSTAEVCGAVTKSGAVCGRNPCPYPSHRGGE